MPKREPGEQVDVEDIAVLIDYVSDRVERAAEVAVELHEGLAADRLAEPRSRKDIVAGLAQFVLGARGWLDIARRHGGPGTVEVGTPSIDDPSLPEWPSMSDQ